MVTWVWLTAFNLETAVMVQVLYNSLIVYKVATTSILPSEEKVKRIAFWLRAFCLSLIFALALLSIYISVMN